MTSIIRRGLVAGAAGTTVLTAITYADMAWRGRDASRTPERSVDVLTSAAGVQMGGSKRQRDNRRTALGALLGIGTGLATGVLAAAARRNVRLPAPLEATVTGAAAMAVSDLPMALAGISDPRTWSRADWLADAVPHLGYGIATTAALRAAEDGAAVPVPASAGLVARSALLGLATGSRSSLGAAAPTLTGDTSRKARLAALVAVGGELTADKLPATPARTSPPALSGRMVAGAAGATALARREQANAAVPLIAGVAGSLAGSYGGVAYRRWAATRWPDWQGAFAEDAAALVLALIAARRR